MRIAFTGTHQVGKTTLAEEIANHLPNFTLIDEPYLQLQESGYLFSEEPSLDDYITQFDLAVKQLEDSDDDILFDRCPLDLLAYIHATDPTKEISALYETMVSSLSNIDLIIFVPIESPDIVSCSSDDLPNLRRKVDEVLQEWVNELNQPMVTVNGTLAHRKKQVLDVLTKV